MNTITRAHRCDLNALCSYLQQQGVIHAGAAQLTESKNWQVVTYELVESFAQQCLEKGMATNSVNQRLSTIRRYARLANQAGYVNDDELAKIEAVRGFYQMDRQPPANSDITRLQQQPNTPQGRRDRLLLDMLIEHGLRVSELELLQVSDVNIQTGEIRTVRAETGIELCHKLNRLTLQSLRDYFYAGDMPTHGPLLRSSMTGGSLTDGSMSSRAIHKRVKTLGRRIGLKNLSPEDLQAYWRHNRQ